MRIQTRQGASMLLGFGVLALALVLLWLGQLARSAVSDKITVREILIAAPPPPPPPAPSVQQPVADVSVAVQVQGSGPTLKMIEIRQQPVVINKPEAPAITSQAPELPSFEVNWDAFALDDLDGLPSLLTPLRTTFPKSLSRQNIDRVLVKLDVLIDEQGQVSLIGVVENPHPELKPEIDKIVRNSRFSAPSKNGEPVRARFIWPVEIKN